MSILAKIRRVLTLICEDATHLISDSLDRDLTLSERLAVAVHAVLCRSCRRFRQQMDLLRAASQRLAARYHAGDWGPSPPLLSEEVRQRIRRLIADNATGGDG